MSELIEISRTGQATRSVDVVFMHGLGGDAITTWQAGASPDQSWPKWLADELPLAGIWSLSYEAAPLKVMGHSMSIHDRAINALAHLEARGLGNAPTVFVCHSLGGLLVKQMIRHGVDYPGSFAAQLREMTKGVVFIATPHSGSDAATWIDRLLKLFAGPLLNELRANGPQLRDLNLWYRNNVGRLGIKHEVYSETRPLMSGVMIVDATSADPGVPDLIPTPLDEDHISICKPSSTNSLLYIRVRTFIGQFARSDYTKPPLPESQREDELRVVATAMVDKVGYVKKGDIGLYLWGDPDPYGQSEEESNPLRNQRRYVETAYRLEPCKETLYQLNEIIPDILRKLHDVDDVRRLNLDEWRRLRQKLKEHRIYNIPIGIDSIDFKICTIISNDGERLQHFSPYISEMSICPQGLTRDGIIAKCIISPLPQEIYKLLPKRSVALDFNVSLLLKKPIFLRNVTDDPKPLYNWIESMQELTNRLRDDELLNRIEMPCKFLDEKQKFIFNVRRITNKEKLDAIERINIKLLESCWEHIRALIRREAKMGSE